MLPFGRFRDPAGQGVDTVLGPEMRSTGEVMASAADFPTAFAKAERAAGRAVASASGAGVAGGRPLVDHGGNPKVPRRQFNVFDERAE